MMLPCQKHITSFTAHSVKSQTCITTGKALYHDIIWSWTTLRPHFLHSSQADYAAVMFACLPFVPRLLNAIFFVRNTLSLLFVYQVATQTSLLQRFLHDNPTKPWVVSSATTFSPLPGFILFIALSTNWFVFFFFYLFPSLLSNLLYYFTTGNLSCSLQYICYLEWCLHT